MTGVCSSCGNTWCTCRDEPESRGAASVTLDTTKRRPWRIEVRYLKYSTALNENDAYGDWTPWLPYRGSFATKAAAEHRATAGDLGYYLSFAMRSEYRVFSVVAS